ncbi:MAG: DUF4178 domain-containing protein [Bacteroidetes bacterium]|nr:DUF4178 domain-containing protein [Bacteroidota bacterium]
MHAVNLNRFTCPGCSAQTELLLALPLFIICPYCGNNYQVNADKTAVATGLRKRDLQPIKTIALGATGKYQNKSFTIIGHIRSINTSSINNEWLMKFSDGTEKWLIENVFSYFVYDTDAIALTHAQTKVNKMGSSIHVKSKAYVIYDLTKQVEFQMDGQIPENCFNDEAYFKYETINWESGNLLSVNIYSKELIEGFMGKKIALAELELSTLKEFEQWM